MLLVFHLWLRVVRQEGRDSRRGMNILLNLPEIDSVTIVN